MVRVCGPQVEAIACAVLGRLPKVRQACFSDFCDADGGLIDQGVAIYFPAPHSFTGDDVLELQGHGGEIVPALVLEAVCAAGARLAEPGEFAKRAFLNGKLDLAQAEAVSDLICSGSKAAARAAVRSLTGVFSKRVHALEQQLLQIRARLEAWLNFPDEPVDEVSHQNLIDSVRTLNDDLHSLMIAAKTGRRLRDGLNLLLIGPPNSGKSSLMNALTGEQTAIVTELPGTTRDLLKASVSMRGVAVTVTDTAGIRSDVEGPIEEIGIARARGALAAADVLIWLTSDASQEDSALPPWLLEERSEAQHLLQVRNKIDLSLHSPGPADQSYYISVHTGAGMEVLIGAISDAGLGQSANNAAVEGEFTARSRHIEALEEAQRQLGESAENLAQEAHFVLVGEQLRLVHEALGHITGRTTHEDLLGEIFRKFCIGK